MPSIYRSAAGRTLVRDWCSTRLEEWKVPHQQRVLTAHGALTHVVLTDADVDAGAGVGADARAGVGEGEGDRPVVVFVPGTNFNAATSLPLLEAVTTLGARVAAIDVPGQPGLSDDDRSLGSGRTQSGAGWYGPWLADTVRQLDLGPVVLAGHSFGGAVVLAADVPTATRRVLVSTAGLCRLRLPPGLLFASMIWLLRPSPTGSARLLRHLHAPGQELPAEQVEWMTLVARHANSSGAPWTADSAVTLPTLVATGEHDVFLPPERLGPAVRARLGAELQVIPGAGHLVVDEQPERIARLIVENAA